MGMGRCLIDLEFVVQHAAYDMMLEARYYLYAFVQFVVDTRVSRTLTSGD